METKIKLYQDYIVDEFTVSYEDIDTFCNRMAKELDETSSLIRLILRRAGVVA